MKKIILLFLVVVSAVSVSLASGKKSAESTSTSPAPDTLSAQTREVLRIDSIANTLQVQTGRQIIGGNIAAIDVPEGFVFLPPKEAQKVLTGIWTNPLDSDVLGILMPKGEDFADDSAWVIVYSYEEDGHVKDDDAADIKYDELLDKLKKAMEEKNTVNKQIDGYRPRHLVGWAVPPFYDKKNHKLHWAKELKIDSAAENILNYNIRMLGRKGVLVLNVVAGMNNLKGVQRNLDKIMTSTNFTKGNTYSDYNESVDKVAEYGVAGLIAGGVLLKTGLLAKIGLMLAASWKFIIGGIMAAFAFLRRKLFGGGSKAQ